MWHISYILHTGLKSLNAVLQYASDKNNSDPINKAIHDIETECKTLSNLKDGKVSVRLTEYFRIPPCG